jgi:hypothetical protein
MDDRRRDLESPDEAACEKVLALIGLARRAGRLAVGATAVQKMVRGGGRPVVLVADGTSEQQRRRWLALRPVRGFIAQGIGRDALARRLGRGDLTVVAVADRGFVSGLVDLGVVTEPREDSAASR